MIVAVGLPGSGNKLFRAHLQRCGVEAHVCNGPTAGEKMRKLKPTHAIIPVRLRADVEASSSWRANPWSKAREREHWKVIWWITARGTPWRVVSYEALVSNPEREGKALAAWLGVPSAPWPTEVNERQPWLGAIVQPVSHPPKQMEIPPWLEAAHRRLERSLLFGKEPRAIPSRRGF